MDWNLYLLSTTDILICLLEFGNDDKELYAGIEKIHVLK